MLPNALVYVATKAAVEQLARVLAKDLGAKGITVNTVLPGPIDTDLFREGKAQQTIDFIANLHPAKRIGLPEEISPVVAFLASPGASWVNGQQIAVNGVNGFFVSACYDTRAHDDCITGLCGMIGSLCELQFGLLV